MNTFNRLQTFLNGNNVFLYGRAKVEGEGTDIVTRRRGEDVELETNDNTWYNEWF